MKIFAVALFVGLVAVASAAQAPKTEKNGQCFVAADNFCKEKSNSDMLTAVTRQCSARFDHFKHAQTELEKFATLQLETSYKYLLMATTYNGYVKNRPGFASHFKGLSDRSWKAGMELIKYITRRGGSFSFPQLKAEKTVELNDLNEVQAMAEVLDTEKMLYETARTLRKAISHAHNSGDHENYDPEAAHMLDEEHLETLASSIRKFSGYANDLKNLHASGKDFNLDTYLFDQYLQKA